MFRKAPEGVAPRRAISIYDMLIPSYEFRDIPRDPAVESRSFGKRHHSAKRRKKEVKSYLTNADRCHYLLRVLRADIPFFRARKPSRKNRRHQMCIDKLRDSVKKKRERRDRGRNISTNNIYIYILLFCYFLIYICI